MNNRYRLIVHIPTWEENKVVIKQDHIPFNSVSTEAARARAHELLKRNKQDVEGILSRMVAEHKITEQQKIDIWSTYPTETSLLEEINNTHSVPMPA
jgi:hypothetical protein